MDRFLYHVLPKHFHRIRYYGFLANGKAKTSIESDRRDLAVETSTPEAPPEENRTCPHCEQGNMITVLILDGYGTSLLMKPNWRTLLLSWIQHSLGELS